MIEDNLFTFDECEQRSDIVYYYNVILKCNIGEFKIGDGFSCLTVNYVTGKAEVFLDDGYVSLCTIVLAVKE